jgi:XTP/dITP diphosphohydrolase
MLLYAATGNPGKLAEFATAAQPAGIAVLALPRLQEIPEPVEDAETFQLNADLKARAYSLTLPGQLVFADDSGLEVSALDHRPGVRSARFADDFASLNSVLSTEGAPLLRSADTPVLGPGSKDQRNNALLLHLLQPHADRSARFVCTLALARSGQVLLRASGTVAGEILHAPRGSNGFGYDPLFLLPPLHRTMAELSSAEKWQLSHRGHAFRSLLAQLSSRSWPSRP